MLSRSGSVRALGLTGLEGLKGEEAGRKEEVEMQRRGSEDTLKTVARDNESGVARIGSVRRGKKLD
jgi:hypothetical protein